MIDASPASTAPERRAPRERSMLEARLTWADGVYGAQGAVTQISASGARLRIDGSLALPGIVTIDVPRRSIHRQARIVWRKDGDVGLAFVDTMPLAEGDGSRAQEKLRLLNEDNGRLRGENLHLREELRRLRGGAT